MSENHIDCDDNPFVPDGWRVEGHQKGGLFKWDASKVEFYLDFGQQDGDHIRGDKLRKRLANKRVLNANILDYLLKNQQLIPEDWKENSSGRPPYIYFWGTIYYRNSDGRLYVRCLHWDEVGGKWLYFFYLLDGGWGRHSPAVVRTS